MQQKALKLEKRYLSVSASCSLLVACAALIASVSRSQAILLDGLFNLAYFATGLFTVKVVSLVAGGDDDRFPHGYSFFEPFVNGIKGMLVLGVSIMALAGAVRVLLTGGSSIGAGIAVTYGLFASIVCWSAVLIMRHGAKSVHSPLINADVENWMVNAVIASCVLLAFAGIFVLKVMGLDDLTPYVDPIVVFVVIAISLFVPVRMSWNSIMALMNRAPADDILRQVTDIVDANLADLPVQERFIRVIQPGRQRMVLIHVVLPMDKDDEPIRLNFLDTIRTKMYQALREAHVATLVDMLFTADRRWGAPLSDGGFGGPAR